MPLSAITSNGETVFAHHMSKEDRREHYYYCRACDGEMRLRIPSHRITHFFHLHKGDCIHEGEGEQHLEAKQFIFDELSKHYEDVDMERKTVYKGVARISDVIVPVSNSNFGSAGTVIEIQNSAISRDEVYNRIMDWRERGYGILWVVTKEALRSQELGYHIDDLPAWARNLCKVMYNHLYIYADKRIFLVDFSSSPWIRHPQLIKNLFLTPMLKSGWTPQFAEWINDERYE